MPMAYNRHTKDNSGDEHCELYQKGAKRNEFGPCPEENGESALVQ